jgi:hypothetical protein
MTPAELRQAARGQNDRDCAAYGIPRYVEDPGVLAQVARLLAGAGEPAAARRRKPARRRRPAPTAARQ